MAPPAVIGGMPKPAGPTGNAPADLNLRAEGHCQINLYQGAAKLSVKRDARPYQGVGSMSFPLRCAIPPKRTNASRRWLNKAHRSAAVMPAHDAPTAVLA